MEYGSNILSNQKADWVLTNGSYDENVIKLNENGVAYQELTGKNIVNIPDTMQVVLSIDSATNSYTPRAWVKLLVTRNDNIVVEYRAPIIYTTTNGFVAILQTEPATYKELSFSIITEIPMNVSYWSLSAPITTQAEIDIDGITQEIPKVLADYNTSTFNISQREEIVALISAHLLNNTDVNGKLQVSFVSSEACLVTLRVKDNNGTELFAPILYDARVGRNSIGVPHAFLKRYIGPHSFTVTAQCSSGTLTFYTRNVLFTIDAGYMAIRTMDVGFLINDITMKRLPDESGPSALYVISIDDDGIARVRFRPYSTVAEVTWTPAFELEKALDVAIEFDGYFQSVPDTTLYTLMTFEEPHVFWITEAGTLMVQIGSDVTSRLALDTGVSMVSSVRGYKSELFLNQDQGLVVAYLKNGEAYYRNYCYDYTTAEGVHIYKWYDVTKLEQLGTNLTFIQVHRLNDYRVGFVGSDETTHKWTISGRTYISAAAGAETLRAGVRMNMMTRISSGYYPELSAVSSEDFLTITITSLHDITLNGLIDDVFTFSSNVSVKSVELEGKVFTIVLNEAYLPDITINLNVGSVITTIPNEGSFYQPAQEFFFDRRRTLTHEGPFETLTINLIADCTLSARTIETTTIEPTETLDAGLQLPSTPILIPHIVDKKSYSLNETLDASLVVTPTTDIMVQRFVGVIPV